MSNLNKRRRISTRSQKTASMLIDQQMWCWGCDVRRKEGNLLLDYGAKKRPSPNPRYRSCYVFDSKTELVLSLWGWGLWIACADWGSLFIGRSRFQLRYTSDVILVPDAWCKKDLPATDLVLNEDNFLQVNHLLTRALRWIGGYEAWISTQVTSDYRERVLAKWPQRRRYKGGIPVAEMAEQWFQLSVSVTN